MAKNLIFNQKCFQNNNYKLIHFETVINRQSTVNPRIKLQEFQLKRMKNRFLGKLKEEPTGIST